MAKGEGELIPDKGSLLGESSMTKGFSSNGGDPKDMGISRGVKLVRRCIQIPPIGQNSFEKKGACPAPFF